MFVTFEMDPSRFPGLWSILARASLPPAGSSEDKFFAGAANIKYHNTAIFGEILNETLKNSRAEWVLISKNQKLILDECLGQRIENMFAELKGNTDQITLLSGGGLGINNESYCAYYSSIDPFIKFHPNYYPITDSMAELYVVSARDARDYIRQNGFEFDESFELAMIMFGYASKNKISLFTPSLAAGINGNFLKRDVSAVAEQIKQLPTPLTSDQTLPTLDGIIATARQLETDEIGRPLPSAARLSAQAVEEALITFAERPTISIVTRTQFKRTFLLRRLLTSISRARVDSLPIEIILSSDIEEQKAQDHLRLLSRDFPNLIIKLCLNRRPEYSRVANLFGGAETASGDYVWFMDDDDYVDLFAFRAIQGVFFCGSRPFIVGDCTVHKEHWDLSDQEFPVLARTNVANNYPGSHWPRLFFGVNHLPICGAVIPRDFLCDRFAQFEFMHDLSEDYTLFLLLLGSEKLPPVVNLSRVISHISVRDNSDNTVTVEDRTEWTRDISNYVYDLLYNKQTKVAASWSTLFSQSRHVQPLTDTTHTFEKRPEAVKMNLEIERLNRENEYLRSIIKMHGS